MNIVSSEDRRLVKERAQGFCEYCLADSKFADSPFDIEHIIPQSEGGQSVSENLALACHGCNLFKSNKTEVFDSASDKNVRLFHPRTDVWEDHFVWTSDFTKLVGLTAIGRATIYALKLNREGLVNQRKMLHKYGIHPPSK
jgi:hypothetical protein